jgi:predicted phage terminase large subunit-like protein
MEVQGKTMQGVCKTKELGTRSFAQQYLGVVVDDAPAHIKRDWWQYYKAIPSEIRAGGIFVDTAHTEKQESDYSVVTTVVSDGVNFYIKDMVRAQVEFPDLERMVLNAQAKHQLPVYIEETPGSMPLIQRLKKEIPMVNSWKIEGRSKLARVQAVLPYFEAGNVFVPDIGHSWVGDMIEECAYFPSGEHDDIVDTVTMALLTLSKAVVRFTVL